jgi:hypothetical protein
MRRCLWDTPYPRTMKSSDLCIRPGIVPPLYPRTTRIPLARQPQSHHGREASTRCVAASSASAQGRIHLAPRLGIVRAGAIRCGSKSCPRMSRQKLAHDSRTTRGIRPYLAPPLRALQKPTKKCWEVFEPPDKARQTRNCTHVLEGGGAKDLSRHCGENCGEYRTGWTCTIHIRILYNFDYSGPYGSIQIQQNRPERSAKPLCVGSIPTRASKISIT